jgi:hypothetical protein
MAVVNHSNEPQEIYTGKDGIVIMNNFESIKGGRALDVTGFVPSILNAGHVIIRDLAGNHKPMPINAGQTAYADLPANHVFVGILVATIPTRKASAGIMLRGTVNEVASPFAFTAAMKTALSLIQFRAD